MDEFLAKSIELPTRPKNRSLEEFLSRKKGVRDAVGGDIKISAAKLQSAIEVADKIQKERERVSQDFYASEEEDDDKEDEEWSPEMENSEVKDPSDAAVEKTDQVEEKEDETPDQVVEDEKPQNGESESLHLVLEPDTEELLDDSQKEKVEETVIESRDGGGIQ